MQFLPLHLPVVLSIIIPTYNEADAIAPLLRYLQKHTNKDSIEIIVSDGGSTDDTLALAKGLNTTVITSLRKGRAAQMNYAASIATGDVLYFLHADTFPPPSFSNDILNAVLTGCTAGCYRLSFNHPHWFLKANCWFTRFDVDAIRFGDQSLFVTKEKFTEAGGFCEKHIVLEDQHLIKRLKKIGRFIIFPKPVVTSARKYLQNGIYKTQGVFYLIYFMYRLRFSQQKLVSTYRKLIVQDKL